MRIRRWSFLTVLALSLSSSRLDAQATAAAALALGGIDKLLDRVEGISLYYGGRVHGDKDKVPWSNDFGLEFTFHVGDAGGERPPDEPDTTKYDVSGLVVKRQHIIVGGRDSGVVQVDSEFTSTKHKPDVQKQWDFDLGVAYGQLDGISISKPFEVTGYVRELPAVSLYASRSPWQERYIRNVSPYVGLRVGVISLQDAQLFLAGNDSLPVVSLSATTFEVGIPFGVSVTPAYGSSVQFIVEGAYSRRQFNSITYNPAKGFPSNAPHRLDLSGWSVDVGVTFPIPKPAK